MTQSSNGEQGVEHQVVDTVVLTYNRATDHLDVGGHAESLDLMLDMLGRATRVLEMKYRQQAALQFAQQQRDAAQAAAIAASLGKR